MEKKLTQRTIGLLVVIAFVIILLPLVFTKNEATSKSKHTKTPIVSEKKTTETPTSDMEIASEIAAQTNLSTDSIEYNTKALHHAANTQPEQPTPTTKPIPDSQIKDQVAQAAPPASSKEPIDEENKNSLVPEQPQPQFSIISKNNKASTSAKTPSKPEHRPAVVKAVHLTKPALEKKTKATLAQHTVHNHSKLRSPAWVVQLGSFNSKSNAKNLTDRLRTAGFKAFSREIKSAKGKSSTRVYVGPEYKQASAVKLSTKLEEKMKLKGIVLSYKPLDL